MVQEHFYRQQEDRDPNVYLGIDDNFIPFEYFKGVYNEEGMVFTDDVWYGIQFLVCPDGVQIIKSDADRDMYVTKEDITASDEWFKIGHALSEYSTQVCGMIEEPNPRNPLHEKLLERYYDGERGDLKESEKVYDEEEIYYMWFFRSFNTEPFENETFLSQVRRHIDFVSNNEDWKMYEFNMETNKVLWKEFLDGVDAMSVLRNIGAFTETPVPLTQEELDAIVSVYDPRLGGRINFVETERNDFVIKIKEELTDF